MDLKCSSKHLQKEKHGHEGNNIEPKTQHIEKKCLRRH